MEKVCRRLWLKEIVSKRLCFGESIVAYLDTDKVKGEYRGVEFDKIITVTRVNRLERPSDRHRHTHRQVFYVRGQGENFLV